MKVTEYRKLNNPLADKQIIMGIDAGLHTGFAAYFRGDSSWEFFTKSFWETHDFFSDASMLQNREAVGIAIEVPRKFMYGRNDGERKEKIRNRMSSDMGGNRREAELLAARFEALGYAVVRVTPTKTKWTADELKRHTGITQRTNEHVRDAIRLVWNHI